MKYTRWIFFCISLAYNFVLGIYLKDFLALSPMLQIFYLLSALPTLFLIVEIKSKAMRAAVLISIIFIACINFVYAVYCRRLFPVLTIISLGIVLIYFIAFANAALKDKLLTKIFVLAFTAVIIVALFTAYIFVYKQDVISLTNGHATLWDTNTVKLADEICVDCDTDEEKVKAIYEWMIHNFEYDYKYEPVTQYFNVRKTLSTQKGVCYDFAHLFAALCRSQNISCYVVDGTKFDDANYHHTWNRVYFNGSWWNVDVTIDIVKLQKQEKFYGFLNLGDNAFATDELYIITCIY